MNGSNPFPFTGLSDEAVIQSRQKNGMNIITGSQNKGTVQALKEIIREPMFLLLVACAVIYLFVGSLIEATFMLVALALVSGISFYQGRRSRRALAAIQSFNPPFSTAIRNDTCIRIPSIEIVIGDFIVATEGELIAADGIIKQANDFSVNEAILTGEAYSVFKDAGEQDTQVYCGTLVNSGQCVFKVTATGLKTRLGSIGLSIDSIATVKTPLQTQISSFVQKMAMAGTVVFLLIWGINWYRSGLFLDSLLNGLTIAMSVLPEEIPVAFASFMALGAYRLMKEWIIVKNTATVEALGSATVICADKTGTITENRMELYQCYELKSDKIYTQESFHDPAAISLITTAMWASEAVPFEPMEQALHQVYVNVTLRDERADYHMIKEYPLAGSPPMMTHVFENQIGNRIIACKGALEALLTTTLLSPEQVEYIKKVNSGFARQGLRVLAVANATIQSLELPVSQQDFKFNFQGLIAFYDPPKKNIADVFKSFSNAGIRTKMITGDNTETAIAISKQTGLSDSEQAITGVQLAAMNDTKLDNAVLNYKVFSRISPELKLQIVESLKRQGEIVAMTGDGVNDGPALKAAHIGIAMGKHGSEIAKNAASLILTDDDLGNMVYAVAMGRRIYTNLKKAVQYIISIHIPIILTVAIPSILGWPYPAIFTPVHVIFLELIMGPTCSIIFEREPSEPNSMLQPPRSAAKTFFSMRELTISIVQGLVITIATLSIYWYALSKNYDEATTRSMVFLTLIMANVFLTLVNRSFYYSIITTLKYKNNILVAMIAFTLFLLVMLFYVPDIANFFNLHSINLHNLRICLCAAFVSVMWFEVYKIFRRSYSSKTLP